ncbi:Zn-ribbon domain-containing OB-fold protein [Chloroflexota bacterium]
MSNEKEPEYINIPIPMRIPYAYDAGLYVSGFLQEIRDNERIYANKCPECGRFLLPPRIMCGRCSVRMGEWIEQGHKGTLVSFGVTIEPQLDVTTGENKEVPFTTAGIQLDGGAAILHFLDETDPSKLELGMRVQAVFKPKEERQGLITDILHFTVIGR